MADRYTGRIRNGVVVLDEGTPPLAEGTRVKVETTDMEQDLESLRQFLLGFAGKAEGLPADMAEQHDHYLHGQPKR